MSRSRKLRTKFIVSPSYETDPGQTTNRAYIHRMILLSFLLRLVEIANQRQGSARDCANGYGGERRAGHSLGTNFSCLRYGHTPALPPSLPSSLSPRNEKVELLRPQIDKPAQEGTTNPRRNLERSVRDENKHYERRLTEIRPVSGANIHFEPRFTTPAACSCSEPRRKAYTPPPPPSLTQFGRLRCARVACATRCRHPCRGLGRGWGGGEEGRETDRGVSVGRGPIKAVHGARVTRVPLMIMIVAPRERKREAR